MDRKITADLGAVRSNCGPRASAAPASVRAVQTMLQTSLAPRKADTAQNQESEGDDLMLAMVEVRSRAKRIGGTALNWVKYR